MSRPYDGFCPDHGIWFFDGCCLCLKELTEKREREAKRKEAQQQGYDDYCEAHQEGYNDECPHCASLSTSKELAIATPYIKIIQWVNAKDRLPEPGREVFIKYDEWGSCRNVGFRMHLIDAMNQGWSGAQWLEEKRIPIPQYAERYQFKEGELTSLLSEFMEMDIAPENHYNAFKEGYRLAMTKMKK